MFYKLNYCFFFFKRTKKRKGPFQTALASNLFVVLLSAMQMEQTKQMLLVMMSSNVPETWRLNFSLQISLSPILHPLRFSSSSYTRSLLPAVRPVSVQTTSGEEPTVFVQQLFFTKDCREKNKELCHMTQWPQRYLKVKEFIMDRCCVSVRGNFTERKKRQS